MIILVDMDGVLADYEREFERRWTAQYPERRYVSAQEVPEFRQSHRYPLYYRGDAEAIPRSPGFFHSLLPVPGGLEALTLLLEKGHEPFICTKPSKYADCVSGKHAWIRHYFGERWVKRTVFVSDKTLVRGDILIDDNPCVEGVLVPTWEHVLYDHPYNQGVPEKRRLTWKNWQDVLKI